MNFWASLKQNKTPIYALAPMDGVTDYVFREIVATTAKPDVLFTEFTNVEAIFSVNGEKIMHRFRTSENQHYIVAQIWGKNPENYYKAAQLISDLGYDGVDINMGCPDKTVMRLESGASLIENSNKAREIISATKEGAKYLSVSVKTRIGITKIITESWLEFLLRQKVDAITIHGRTAKELSKCPVHWDEIEKSVRLKNNISPETIILGNGDIVSQEESNYVCDKYGVDGVMIGKGIFSNPWIFEQTPRDHTNREYFELLLKHARLYTEIYPDKRCFSVLKKFFLNYVKSFHGAANVKKQLMLAKNYAEVEDIIKPLIS